MYSQYTQMSIVWLSIQWKINTMKLHVLHTYNFQFNMLSSNNTNGYNHSMHIFYTCMLVLYAACIHYSLNINDTIYECTWRTLTWFNCSCTSTLGKAAVGVLMLRITWTENVKGSKIVDWVSTLHSSSSGICLKSPAGGWDFLSHKSVVDNTHKCI